MPAPAVSVVVPTRNRAEYLSVALASIVSQQPDAAFEVVVVDDGSTDATAAVARAAGIALERHPSPRGPNAARNTGIGATSAPLIVFVDDDVRAPPGWLVALLEGARAMPWADALGGPIRASLEGAAPRSCGREAPPVTTLDLGPSDAEARFVWSANMAIRRSAVERIGGFDESVPIERSNPSGSGAKAFGFYGDEEEWLMRLHSDGGRVAYVAAAGLDHRRAGDDARLRSLARAEYRRGRAASRNDRRKRTELPLPRELRNLAGAGWHMIRRRCPLGAVMIAHTAGRLTERLGARR
ncbi:MAG: glycosyltransferase family A protein [Thermoleophilaceae bacterium]